MRWTEINPERRVHMASKHAEFAPLTRDELTSITGEQLPERAAMSLVTANLAIPVNLGLAANVLSDNSAAISDATQGTPISQVA